VAHSFASQQVHDAIAPHIDRVVDASDPAQADAYVRWWTRPGRVILGEDLGADDDVDADVWTGERTPGALTIAQTCAYDPGSAAYRFHSAINHTTPHASALFRGGNQNPYTNYRQLDMGKSRSVLAVAIGTADVVHCHVDTWALSYTMVRWKGQLVVNYHGSVHPSDAATGGPQSRLVDQRRDDRLEAIQIGARLDHSEYGDLAWVPMTQPVRRLAALRAMYAPHGRGGYSRPFRIAHSPTYRSIKGTDVFLEACDRLTSKGLKVQAVLIEGHKHPQALAWKATCDACFDSFWLGLQGSGLEAGAMGMPVIAGDARTKRLHEAHIGYCPYLFADDAAQLEEAIAALIEAPLVYEQAAEKMRRYVWHWHSYERVSAMYLNVLAERGKPELQEKIRQAIHTPSDGATVPAMRPGDDYPWLKAPEDPPLPLPGKITTPQGEPVHVPRGEPVHTPAPEPKRYQVPEPMVTR